MEAIRIFDIVTDKGLNLNNPALAKLVNQKVEITILPIINEEPNENSIMEFAGMLSEEDAKIFEEALADCRKIDYEGWNEKLFD